MTLARQLIDDQTQLSERVAEAATRLRQPCLLVRGADSDVLSTSVAREFIELAASSTLAEVPRAGHMVAGDNNNAFAAAIRAWLDTSATRTRARTIEQASRR
jgi:pimeloyl-ACP methyl ester carboxylesterase